MNTYSFYKALCLVLVLIAGFFSMNAQNPPRVKLNFDNCSIDRSGKKLTCNGTTLGLDGVGSYTPTFTTSQHKSGNKAMRFELRNDEYLGRSNSYRTEIELHRFHQNDIRDRNEFYLGFWLYVPGNFPDQKGWQVIAQYKQPGGSNGLSLSPPIGIEITSGSNPKFQISIIGDSRSKGVSNTNQQEKKDILLGNVTKGKWTHFVIHSKFNPKKESSNNKKGRVRVWMDGKLKADHYGRVGYEFAVGIQTRIGMYRSRSNHTTASLIYDDIILDYSYNAVAPKGSSPNPTPTGNNSSVVHMRKRNASTFAIDGGNGGTNKQNVILWGGNSSNVNQQWEEINRGGGYYSYRKANTDYCLDGGSGGANGQNVYLFKCGDNNQNQHWKKVNAGSNNFRLEKRNAPRFALDGGSGGARGQNVYLWSKSATNQNQQWTFSKGTGGKAIEKSSFTATAHPNPFHDQLTIQLGNNKSLQQITLINISGGVILSKQIEANTSEVVLSPEDLASGIYFLRMVSEGTIETIKILKN